MKPLFDSNEKDLKNLISKANVDGSNEYENLGDLKQGSKVWFNMRLGKFTGSKIPDLMRRGRGKEEWGATSLSVIKRVFVERDLSDIGKELYIDELFNKRFRQTEWGNKYESYAREEYQKELGFEVVETCFEIHPKFPFIGGSFDGRIVKPKKGGIIEIKCPYDVLVHENNTSLDEDSMKNTSYYPQIQCNIDIAGVDFCDFISYDPRRVNKKIHIVRVKRDNDFISDFLLRAVDAENIIDYMDIGISAEEALLLKKKR
jgi:hypothetical protein